MITCCEHNPCPDRPRFFLGRFQHRPWRCTQCGTWWVTFYVSSFYGGVWSWKRVKGKDEGHE